jgi:hypothetical protein
MRRLRVWWLAAILVLGVASIVVMLPPRARVLAARNDIPEPVRGTMHVHTRRSDGSGTIDDVAAAAARAGLRFVVLSDHGSAIRPPQPPTYRHGVLCIDAVEVTTFEGHVLALGLSGVAPYPLGGEPRDVIDDIRRLGGMSIAAHPTSAKRALRWQDWDAPFDGLEWLNADSEWRDERPQTMVAALLTYPFRRAETLASLLDRPADALARWDALLQHRRVVATAGADAHASIVNGEDNPYSDRSPIILPAYEQSFKTFSVALPDVRLTGDAAVDARLVLDAIRNGDSYTSIEGIAHPARLLFTARSGKNAARSGEVLIADGPIRVDVRTNAPEGAHIVLLQNGQRVARSDGPSLSYENQNAQGVFRAEVYLGRDENTRVPWIVTNPIYGGVPPADGRPQFVASKESDVFPEGLTSATIVSSGWGIEKSAKALGVSALDTLNGESRLVVRYTLGGTRSDSPWVAQGVPVGRDLVSFDHLAFKGSADRPMRIWVQFWRPVPTGNQYWRRSVYLDTVEREIVIPFSEMLPSSTSAPRAVPLNSIVTMQFVVDSVHTPLGQSGRFWIGDIRYQR